MCGAGTLYLEKPKPPPQEPEQRGAPAAAAAQPITSMQPVIGTPETAKTQIGDSGVATLSKAKAKPRSLLSAAGGAGDTTGASTATSYAKATLGA